MRTILSALVMLLVLVAAIGYGFGFWLVNEMGGASGGARAGAVALGFVPFAVGTAALGSLAIVVAIEVSARERSAPPAA
jgi:hypothetical protein